MATLTRRFAWLPREPQPQPLSDKAVQIVQILQRFPKGLSASEIVKKSGGTFLVNHVYVYLRRLQARGIVKVLPPEKGAAERGQRDVLRATLAPGQVVKRPSAAEQRAAAAAAAEPRRAESSRRATTARAEPRRAAGTTRAESGRRAAGTEPRRGESRRTQAAAGH